MLIFIINYRNQDSNSYILSKPNIIRCNDYKNSTSCNISLKCVDQQMPWKELLIPQQIDSSIDKVNYNFN